jgi:hypothetical protein
MGIRVGESTAAIPGSRPARVTVASSVLSAACECTCCLSSRMIRPLYATPSDRLTSVTRPPGEFLPGHYCRDCGWPFTASQRRTHCQVRQGCMRRQELPLDQRDYGCAYNDRVHPEWRDLHSHQ